MSKKIIQLSIPKPCSEKWNEMTQTEKGRFCSFCERNLIDFTHFSDDELLRFVKNNNQKICGRFSKNQLDRKIESTSISENKIIQYSKVAGFVLHSFLAFNCNSQNNVESKTEINKTTLTNEYLLEIVNKNSGEPIPFHPVKVKNELSETTDINGLVKISTKEVLPVLDLELNETGYIEKEINLKNINQTNGRYLIELEEIPIDSNTVIISTGVPSYLKLEAKIIRIQKDSLYEYSFIVVDSITNDPIPAIYLEYKGETKAVSDIDGKILVKVFDSLPLFQIVDKTGNYTSKEIDMKFQSKTNELVISLNSVFENVEMIVGTFYVKPKWWQIRRRIQYRRMTRN